MTPPSKTFRVFVSSTFSDLKAERNALQDDVFPKLKRLCLQNGCRFQAIDLRWGVSEEASLDQKTLSICLKEIKRCQEITPRPNFIVLLGDRYGWQPLPFEIPEAEFEEILSRISSSEKDLLCWREDQPENKKGWYRLDDNAVPSVYCLQPRTGAWTDEVLWSSLERTLRDVLLKGISNLPLNSAARRRYMSSATDQEIEAGIFDEDQIDTAAGHAYCFFRSIKGLPSETTSDPMEKQLLGSYLDVTDEGKVDQQAQRSLDCLKDRLAAHLPGHVFFYEAHWLGKKGVTGFPITTQHIEQFCDDAYKALSQIILSQIRLFKEITPQEEEIVAHNSFARKHTAFFLGRREILATIMDYLEGDSPHPFAILGPMGSGKTALLAKSVELFRSRRPQATIVTRFLGATSASSLGATLMDGICRQLGAEITPTAGFSELVQAFVQRLSKASLDEPIILFIDALDQLVPSDPASLLAWIPSRLPPYVRLIVSTQCPSNAFKILEKRLPSNHLMHLSPLTPKEIDDVLALWFKGAGRTLSEAQWQTIAEVSYSRGLPLYLKLAFEEARHWKSFSLPSALPGDIPGLIKNLFIRLARDDHHGNVLVSRSLGYLSAARHGLSEDELLEILSQDKQVLEDFNRRSHHDPQQMQLPVVLWARLKSDLDSYIALRRADNTELLCFFHPQMGEEAAALFLPETERLQRHRTLAKFFFDQPLKWKESGQSLPNLRCLSELPYHQTQGALRSELLETLTAPEFVETKAAAGLSYDLLADLDRALHRWDCTCLHQLRQALVQAVSWMAGRPKISLQVFFNRLNWIDPVAPALKSALTRWDAYLEARGFWLKAAAPLPGTEAKSSTRLTLGTPTVIQSLSSNGSALAAATMDGALELRDTVQGTTLDRRQIRASGIVAIALRQDLTVAFTTREGVIGIETSDAVLASREGEKILTAHPRHGIFCVDQNHSLVAWNPEKNSITLLANNLPQPLVALRLTNDGAMAFFVAGHDPQLAGFSCWDKNTWRTATFIPKFPRVIDADLDPMGKQALLSCLDRSIRLLTVENPSTSLAVLKNYEAHSEGIQGKPQKVRFGKNKPSAGWIFFATGSGHLAAWHWEDNQLVRLENFHRSITYPSSLSVFEINPNTGRLFYSTETFGREISQTDVYRSTGGHLATVTSCQLTDTEKVVSLSEPEQTVGWFTSNGLTPLAGQSLRFPSALAARPGSDEIFLGDSGGYIWVQHPHRPSPDHNRIQVTIEDLVHIEALSPHQVLAAGKSGRIVKVNIKKERTQVVWSGSGFRNQLKILPAGRAGLCWSVYRDELIGDSLVISLVTGVNRERVVLKKEPSFFYFDTAISSDGAKLALAGGEAVEVFRSVRKRFWRRPDWVLQLRRETKVKRLAFLGHGEFLAVILFDSPWLEVWAVDEGLPTVASAEIPGLLVPAIGGASCLGTRGHRLVVGFHSGNLMSLLLTGNSST
jgi:hypothetical protein